jgi:histone acetyltransferase (RNA polymerase elongator complex component)
MKKIDSGGIEKSHSSGLFKNVQMQGAQKTELRGVYGNTLSGAVCSATQQMSVFQQSPGNPLIIPIFIMNSGCPHRCIFCNQKITAGNFPLKITKDFFDSEVQSYLAWNKNKSRKVEIAFYGGSFTGVAPAYREELLSWAYSFIQNGLVHSIRISTRPDYITESDLPVLKKYGVATVEIGAESFINEVLQFAQRGHDAAAIVKAMNILKDHGFQTGLHLMAGLPKDTKEGFVYSLNKTIELQPDTVRIHPVIVFNGTVLAEELRKGEYKPLELADAIELCKLAWEKLSAAGIRIIRIGVQLTKEMERNGAVLAGPIHPALGSLVLSSIFYDHTIKLLDKISPDTKELRFDVSERDGSNFRGLNNMNISAIKKLYPRVNLIVESNIGQRRGVISIATDSWESFTLTIPGIN